MNYHFLSYSRSKFLHNSLWMISLCLAALLLSAAAPLVDDQDVELAERGYNAIPTTSQVVLTGADILGSYGVDVIFPEQGPLDYSGYLPFQYQCTAGGCYQCIEFVLWLYDQQLGYPYKWPGDIWNPYQLIGVVQIAGQLAYQVQTNLISAQNAKYLLYEPYTDLTYYPDGSRTPPQPGDILISADGGHSMVVNRVGGDQLEVVQQNNWEIKADPQPAPLDNRQVYFSGGVYNVQSAMGWIHSPRWADKFTQTDPVQAAGETLQWTRSTDALQISLNSDTIHGLAAGPQTEKPYAMAQMLAASGALQFTNRDYVLCVLRRLAEILQNDAGLANAATLQVEIPYSGSSLTLQVPGSQPVDYPRESCGWNG
jgi:hypothetical protein